MNKREFQELIEESVDYGANQIVSAQALIKEYPYCQSLQSILCKAFHESENLNFEAQLKITAAYASDRKRLHELLFSNSFNSDEHVVESNKVETDNIISQEQDLSQEEPQVKGALEQQILTSAINSSVMLEVSDEIPDISELSPNKHQIIEEESLDTKSIQSDFNETEVHSFSDWINYYGDGKGIDELSTEAFIDPDSTLEINSDNLPAVKAEFYSAAKMAKLSVQENDDLITETLANIYVDQGNLEKAINAFEKLQLKYPEKRVYFAGRIKEIQQQHNE